MPRLSVDQDGIITAIYSDELQGLNEQGDVEITRASHVEPNEGGFWIVTMTDGFKVGGYRYRADAIAAEVAYLERQLFGQ